MILRLTFQVDPRAKQRARVSVLDSSGRVRTKTGRQGRPVMAALAWTPEVTRLFEEQVSLQAQSQLNRLGLSRPVFPSPAPVLVAMTFWLAQPKSGKGAASRWPTIQADLDNLMKALWDGLHRVLWTDDAQVIHSQDTKLWTAPGTQPRITMVAADLEGMAELVRSEGESAIRAISSAPGDGAASSAESRSATRRTSARVARAAATS